MIFMCTAAVVQNNCMMNSVYIKQGRCCCMHHYLSYYHLMKKIISISFIVASYEKKWYEDD